MSESPPSSLKASSKQDGETILLTYKYRILMTKRMHTAFNEALDHTAPVYNAALEEQIDRYRKYQTFLKAKDQAAQKDAETRGIAYQRRASFTSEFDHHKGLTELRQDPEFARYPVAMQRWAVQRLHEAFKGFFSRVKRGETPGFPRFRARSRVRSFGTATLSSGFLIENPKVMDKHKAAVRKAQRALSRARKGSNQRAKKRARLAQLKEREAQARNTHLHQVSRAIARSADVLVVEKLNLKKMTRKEPGKKTLNRSLQDAGLGKLRTLLSYKMRLEGGVVVEVNPAYTSQMCSKCTHVEKANRKGQAFSCRACGHTEHADINAAHNIKHRGVVIPGSHNLGIGLDEIGNISFSN